MELDLKPFAELKNKTTIAYTLTSIAVLIVGAFAFFYFSLGTSQETVAVIQTGPVIKSINSEGTWASPSTWSLNRAPKDGDKVIIEKGHKLIIEDEDVEFNGEIVVNGELVIWDADLIMNAASKVAVNSSGLISFSPPTRMLRLPTANLTIASSYNWFLGWNGGTIVNDQQQGPVAFGTDGKSLLPIELLAFNATLNEDEDTDIIWVTASEENNDYFTIERSLDGKNFFTLDTIDGAGNSKEQLKYKYVDDAPVAGYNYYRLKQTDVDGKSETFRMVSVYNDNAAPELNIVSLGPNPYRDYFEINFTSIDESPVHLKISDMNGRTIFRKTMEAQKGDNSFTYVDRKDLKPGIYLFTIVQKGTPAKTFRLVKDS